MNYSDEDLLEYLDSQMSVAAAKRLREAAENDASLQDRMDVMEASRLPFSAAYREVSQPPVPASLKKEVSDWSRVARSAPRRDGGHSLGRIAGVACVALSLGALLGYVLAPAIPGLASDEVVPATLDKAAALAVDEDEPWVARVADYQSLYVAETVREVQGGRVRAEALLSGVEKRTSLDTAIPDLSEFGYAFARAQQLGYEGDALVQLVYTRPGRKPLAFCYMSVASQEARLPRLTRREALGTASWRSDGQRYVIVADEPDDTLGSMVEVASRHWL